MKLWMASDNTHGAWYNVDEIAPYKHGRAESGEILQYWDDAKQTELASYYWDQQRTEYVAAAGEEAL